MLILFGDGTQIIENWYAAKIQYFKEILWKGILFFSMFFAINLISGWILNVLLSLWKHESTQNICPLPRKNSGENNSVLPQGGGLYCREPWWNEQAIWGILFFGLRKVWGAFWGLTVYAHVYLQHFIIS